MSTSRFPRRRWVPLGLAVLGGLLFLSGVLTIIWPDAADASLRTVVALLGNDYFVVAIVGIVALLVGVAVLVAYARTGIDQATPPGREEIHPVPRFGEEFDDFVAGGGLRDMARTDRHEEIRAQLREIAVITVMRDANCTQAEARDRIDAGTWTDNDEAATFLAESPTPPSVRAWLRAAVRRTSPFTEATRVTAAEIARRDGEAKR